MSLLDSLPHLATAKLRRRANDTMGGSKDTYPTTVFTDRACWRQPLADKEVTSWKQRTIDVTHKVFFVADPELDERHVLEIGTDRMAVKSRAHPDDSCGLGVLWRVVVELLGNT
jgi:hypothetical protein